MKKVVIVITVFFVFIYFIGCTKPDTPKNFILLVDLSSSVDTGLTRWYQKLIRELVIPNLGPKDKLIILPIDKGSVTSGNAIFSVDFSKFEYGNEYGGLDQANIKQKNHTDSIASAVNRFSNEFETAIISRRSLSIATNIIGAIKEAKHYFDPSRKNFICLLSDMQQQSEEYSVTFNDDSYDESSIKDYLANVEKPDLSEFSVLVLTGPQQNMSDKQYDLLRRFWTQYFVVNNAILLDYSSGAVTVLEQTLQQG